MRQCTSWAPAPEMSTVTACWASILAKKPLRWLCIKGVDVARLHARLQLGVPFNRSPHTRYGQLHSRQNLVGQLQSRRLETPTDNCFAPRLQATSWLRATPGIATLSFAARVQPGGGGQNPDNLLW